MPKPETVVHAPEIPPTLEWINVERLSMRELAGQVVLVDFWDYSCPSCLRTLPYLNEWHSRYSQQGLQVVGVHSPKFAFDKQYETVEAAVERLGIKYPVAVDEKFELWFLYGNEVWPAKYLWQADGTLAWYHFGEGEYQETEAAIQEELLKVEPGLKLPELMEPLPPIDAGSPE